MTDIYSLPGVRRGARRAVLLTAFGREQSLNGWQSETGITVPVIARRLRRGLTPEQALSTERASKNKASWTPVVSAEALREMYLGRRMTQDEIAVELGTSRKVVEIAMRRFAIKRRVAAKRDQRMEKNLQWKGGVCVDGAGYVLVKKRDHHRANARGYVRQHVLVAEEKLGRRLEWFGSDDPRSEIVHHIDENKQNNHPDNLEVMTVEQHALIHHDEATGCFKTGVARAKRVA